MMHLGFNLSLICCAVLFGTILFLYFMDFEEFLYRISDKLFRIKLWYSRRYGKFHRELLDKYHMLRVTKEACWEAITRYIVRTDLQNLDNDEILLKLLELHKKIDSLDKNDEDDFSLEEVKDLLHEVNDTFDPIIAELEEKLNFKLGNVTGKYLIGE